MAFARIAVLLIAFATHTEVARAVPPGPGGLDPTFGNGGVVESLPLGPVALLPQANGELLVAGNGSVSGGPAIALARLLSNGSLDATFGDGGVVRTVVNPLVPQRVISVFATAALQQPDGKVVIAGVLRTDAQPAVFVLRYHADGSLDATFGAAGIVVTPLTGDNNVSVSSVLLQGDGKLVVAGTLGAVALLRYQVNGSLDATFGDRGIAIVPPDRPVQPNIAYAALLHADGKIVVAAIYGLLRFDANGALDTTFGGGALVSPTFTDVLQTADGKLLAAGVVGGGDGALGFRNNFTLSRMTSDGVPDATFGNGGTVVTGVGGYRRITSARIDPWGGNAFATLVAQPDGRPIVIAKAVADSSGNFAVGLVRYSASGSVDANFGHAGKAMLPLGEPSPHAAAIQADGKLVVGLYQSATLARYVLDAPYTTTTVTSDRDRAAADEIVTFAATVSGQMPTGTVQFRQGTAIIPGCSASVVSPVPAQPTAYCSTMAIGGSPDPATITATYSGDVENPPSTSPDFVQQVKPPATGAAIEFYHAVLDDYFLTSSPNEIAKLDAGVVAGWQRTGEFFLVYEAGTPSSVPMCRFYSGVSFAPKSAHFYTPFAAECAALKGDSTWVDEGDAFSVTLLDSRNSCATGSLPLFRLYNNFAGGSSNHRFTVSLRVVRNQMLLPNWGLEGDGPAGAAMCTRDAGP
jgi:uncharacterized delta-60 repeat protein